MAHLHVVGGTNVRIHHMTTQAPTASPNTDSLGINKCNGVVIEDCKLETGALHDVNFIHLCVACCWLKSSRASEHLNQWNLW